MESMPENVNEFLKEIKLKESELLYGDHELSIEEVSKEILKLNFQKTRFVFNLYKNNLIEKSDFYRLSSKMIIDRDLMRLWNKKGTEGLCCVQCLPKNSKTGKACICRIPLHLLQENNNFIECINCGCSGCSGSKKD